MRAVRAVAGACLGWSVFVAVAMEAGCSSGESRASGADAAADATHDASAPDTDVPDGSPPIQVDASAPACAPGEPCPALEVNAANGHACALLRDGAVWCWGEHERGELGSAVGRGILCTGRGEPTRC